MQSYIGANDLTTGRAYYKSNQIESNGIFQLRAQEGQTIMEEILHTMINDD